MTAEELIKRRHIFQDNLKQFLEIASIMTNRELEIALAKLFDQISATDSNPANTQLKGEVIKSYFELRANGNKKHRQFKRFRMGFNEPIDDPDYLPTRMVRFHLLPDGDTSEIKPEKTKVNEIVRLLAP